MTGHQGALARIAAHAGRLAHRHRGEGFVVSERIAAPPERVLRVLDDPESVRAWFPLPFEFRDDPDRLQAGETYRVEGRLGGKAVHPDLQVLEATPEHISVRLLGPVIFDLDAVLTAAGGGTNADIRVSVHSGGGLTGRLLTPAASALLRAGALNRTIHAIRDQAERG